MKKNMSSSSTTLFITLTLLFILPLSIAAASSSSKKAVSDASGKACTSIARSDRTIAYDLCFSTLSRSKSADLNSLSLVAVSQAQFQIKKIVKKLNELKDEADGEDKVDRYRACLAGYNRLNGYVSSAWRIVSGKTHGDAKRDLRNAIASARTSAYRCEKLFTGAAGRRSPITTADKKVESLVKIAAKILIEKA